MSSPQEATYKKAAAHLSKADPILAAVIRAHGLCTIKPHTDYYGALVGSIISQQLSVKAADTIERRFCALFGSTGHPAPEAIVTKSIDELRSVGLSRNKAMYIRDLAEHVASGKIQFGHMHTLSNDEIISELTAVKGIGEWTVHMFLMFCMGRLDIVAHGDLGIRNAIRKLYGLTDAPSPKEVIALAEDKSWAPYQTIACWYLWRSLDNTLTS